MKVSKVTGYLLCGMILAAGILFLVGSNVLAEDVTITTYYPAPYGVYGELEVDKNLDGNTATVTGLLVDIDESGTNTGTVTGLGVDVSGVTSGTYYAATFQGGNVGIGLTNPGEKLEVTATNQDGGMRINVTNSDGGLRIRNTNAGGAEWFIDSSGGGSFYGQGNLSFVRGVVGGTNVMTLTDGKVGIGTVDPKAKLSINGKLGVNYIDKIDAGVQLHIGPESGQHSNIRMDGSDGGFCYWGYNVDDHHLAQSVSDGTITTWNAMVIKPNGNVGIGTTGPTDKLDVSGGVKIGASYAGIGTTAPSNGLLIEGNVGIGTVDLGAYKLKVNGDIHARDIHATGVYTCGSDLAEEIGSIGDILEPGDVVTVSKELAEKVVKSNQAYDHSVIGIVSAEPGMVLGVGSAEKDEVTVDGVTIALVGRVPAKVTTENGPIYKGDLLVTASKAGYLMKGSPEKIKAGMLVGKAMDDLSDGEGEIIVFVE